MTSGLDATAPPPLTAGDQAPDAASSPSPRAAGGSRSARLRKPSPPTTTTTPKAKAARDDPDLPIRSSPSSLMWRPSCATFLPPTEPGVGTYYSCLARSDDRRCCAQGFECPSECSSPYRTLRRLAQRQLERDLAPEVYLCYINFLLFICPSRGPSASRRTLASLPFGPPAK